MDDNNNNQTSPDLEDFLGPPAYLSTANKHALEPLFPNLDQRGEVPNPVYRVVDFANSPLPEYARLNCYASVIDNAFTPAECDELLRLAEASSPNGTWPIAQVNVGGNRQVTNTDYRNSDRIIYDDQSLADKLWKRVAPLVEKDIKFLDPEDFTMGQGPLVRKGTASKRNKEKFRMTRLNERLRYLRYEPGGFFRSHTDGAFTTADHNESSLYTFHVYLSTTTGAVPLKGGATRFWELNAMFRTDMSKEMLKKKNMEAPRWFDVDCVPGRVLIFQHANLLHSGEGLEAGVKLTIRTDIMYEKVPDDEVEAERRRHLKRNWRLE